MDQLKILGTVFWLAFIAVACNTGKSVRKGIVIAESTRYEATLYRQNCAICHGSEAYGKMVDGKPVPALRLGGAQTKTEEEIYRQIAHGKLPMPSFAGQLTEKEMRQMARFIVRDLQGREIETKNLEELLIKR